MQLPHFECRVQFLSSSQRKDPVTFGGSPKANSWDERDAIGTKLVFFFLNSNNFSIRGLDRVDFWMFTLGESWTRGHNYKIRSQSFKIEVLRTFFSLRWDEYLKFSALVCWVYKYLSDHQEEGVSPALISCSWCCLELLSSGKWLKQWIFPQNIVSLWNKLKLLAQL